MAIAVGWAGTTIGPDERPFSLPAGLTLYPEMLEAPALLTNIQLVLLVLAEIAPENGERPVDAALGLRGVNIPGMGSYLNWPTWAAPASSAYTKFTWGSTINVVGPQQAATGEPTAVRVPLGVGQVVEI